jgi:hypothetical protein
MVSSSIIDYYYTQIIGNPNNLPILKATASFKGFGLINGDPYGPDGLQYGATDVFYRQIRNLVFDLTDIPAETVATGVHWPTSQATSIQNCIFRMSEAAGNQHQGLFVESGRPLHQHNLMQISQPLTLYRFWGRHDRPDILWRCKRSYVWQPAVYRSQLEILSAALYFIFILH